MSYCAVQVLGPVPGRLSGRLVSLECEHRLFKHLFLNSRHTKDTVNYCVLINKLLELMGHECMQLEKNKNIQMYGGRTISPS